ncbi:hypothetical protein AMAG_01265 [Allomyces macrogynus ATCC 38327]|uniref:Amino acid transporter n=1 Tax=Allomyces macrogynus (strain ATCC 38327) TaxID=578462 RepID=A0A0L0RYZ7_ALLM3|nr:hypothetical protein AMAG_01265 [Allomyces macrogynus ATCC 38327]|eukprot:KNE55365.1 hypothetical protein AMAG_01265 [Allomyces macrogynus ATCC 38327]
MDTKTFDSSSLVDVEVAPAAGLSRTMSLWGGTSLIIGCMVGTGVFSNGGRILALVGSPGMAMIIWFTGALVSLAGAFSYTELGMMMPESGGDLPYLEFIYRKPKQLMAFLYCWCRIVLVHTGYTAALGTVVAIYLKYAFPLAGAALDYEEWVTKAIAVATITTVFCLLAFSNTIATKSTSIITALKLVIILFVVVTGIVMAAGGFPSVPNPSTFADSFEGTSTSPGDYATALLTVFFCYDGWSYLSTAMGELKDPQRNAPRAIVGGVSTVSALYIGANLAYLSALSASDVKGSKEVLAAEFATRVYGEVFGKKVMALLITFSAYGTCLAISFAASRVLFEAARREFVPFASTFSKLHPRFGTPFNALVLHYVMSVVLAIAPPGLDTFFFICDAAQWPVWVLYSITLVGLLVLRRREPLMDRPFRVWLVAPLIVIAAGIFVSVLPFTQGGKQALAAGIGLVCMALGIPAYYFVVYRPQSRGFKRAASSAN